MIPDRDARLIAGRAGSAAVAGGTATVAVVRSDNRRGAVAEALAMLDGEIRAVLVDPVVILPRIGRQRSDSADPGALSSVIDAAISATSGEVVVASGINGASGRFKTLGYRGECWGRRVRFEAFEEPSTRWIADDGPIRVASRVAEAGCRIVLSPLAAIRGKAGGPASLVAALDAIHPEDWVRARAGLPESSWPTLSVVEGPVGLRGRVKAAIVGLDALAVDAVAAALLGLAGGRLGALDRLAEHGRGIADRARITVVGDAVGPIRPGIARFARNARGGLRLDMGHGDLGGTS